MKTLNELQQLWNKGELALKNRKCTADELNEAFGILSNKKVIRSEGWRFYLNNRVAAHMNESIKVTDFLRDYRTKDEPKPFEPVNGETYEFSEWGDFSVSRKGNFIGMEGNKFIARIGESLDHRNFCRPIKPKTELSDEQIDAVSDWLDAWEQLKNTAIPLRFIEHFKPKQ